MEKKEATQCAVCHQFFDVTKSFGRWECRTHVVREKELQNGRLVYPCCDLSSRDELTSYSFHGLYLSAHSMLGCVKADHVVATGPPSLVDPLRNVEDLHLLSDIKQASAFASIPKAAIVSGPKELAYGDINMKAKASPPTEMVIEFNVARNGDVVLRDLREATRQLIELAYARGDFYASAEYKRLRREAIASRHNIFGAKGKAKEFLEETRTLSDDKYLVQWFTRQAKNDLKVKLCVVRAVAPTQDEDFLTRLKALRTYASSHDPLR